MSDFETQLQNIVVSPTRLISETLQLENYIFRDPTYIALTNEEIMS